MSNRMDKVNRQIKKRLMEIIQEEVDDPNMGVVSIVRVETSKDLRISKVFYSVLGDKTQAEYAGSVLDKLSGFMRYCLGKKIRIKFLPELEFIPDNGIEYSVSIYKKIEEVKGDK